jgi:hypothetical protein
MSNSDFVLPHNVAEFEDDRFFKFVKSVCGEKLALSSNFKILPMYTEVGWVHINI